MTDKIAEDAQLALVLASARAICSTQGNVLADEIAAATSLDACQVGAALRALVGRGDLLARPGGIYARALTRRLRLPGESYVSALAHLTVAVLMGARA
jgi:hypothetical protein